MARVPWRTIIVGVGCSLGYSEVAVKARIKALVDHLEGLQIQVS